MLIVCFAAHVFAATPAFTAAPAAPADDDGLTPQLRRDIYGGMNGPTGSGVDRDVIIVHRSKPIVYFGMYRTSMMTEPGWDLYARAVDWANGFKAPADSKVWLATYNGTLDPEYSAERDGIAVYGYLINTMGFPRENVHVAHQSSIETGNFDGYDIVLYVNLYPRDATNVLNQGKPFVTTSPGETDELGIGTGEGTMHEVRDNVYVLNTSHHITKTYEPGQMFLQAGMWMDASTAAGDGIVLIAADDRPATCGGGEKLKARCKRGGKLTAKVKGGLPDAVLTVALDTGETSQININDRGKGKAKFKDVAPGERTVTLTECGLEAKTVCPE
ncbi:MAG: hypothetical protein C4547_13235 [Phycisphaerales bacterium]|nr:MAG: hypothetical protein C4547_13235 [Phycisphaerales bacterium]